MPIEIGNIQKGNFAEQNFPVEDLSVVCGKMLQCRMLSFTSLKNHQLSPLLLNTLPSFAAGRNYMERNLHIAQMEFSEVAAFLLSDDDKSEEQESRRKSIERSTARVRNANNRVSYAHGGREWVRQKREALQAPDEHKNRPFLAQYAVSEIPSLQQDLIPFPDLIKTGECAAYWRLSVT